MRPPFDSTLQPSTKTRAAASRPCERSGQRLGRLAFRGRLPGAAAVLGHFPLERLRGRRRHDDRVLGLDELAAHLVLARPVPGVARKVAGRLSHHAHAVEAHVLVDLLLAIPAEDGLGLHLSHGSARAIAADHLESALVPGAVRFGRHLAARAPRSRLHRGLALPLPGKDLQLLGLRPGLGRLRVLVGQGHAGAEAHSRENRCDSSTRHPNLHSILLIAKETPFPTGGHARSALDRRRAALRDMALHDRRLTSSSPEFYSTPAGIPLGFAHMRPSGRCFCSQASQRPCWRRPPRRPRARPEG